MSDEANRHPLEIAYQLTATEMLDALSRRFRARVALEGAVAEVHLAKKIRAFQKTGGIASFEEHDKDAYPDFTITLGTGESLTVECKNVRDKAEAYRTAGQVVAYKVETQKTRAAQGDPSSRYYDIDYFDILAVCLGKKTGDWTQFVFARTENLARHRDHPNKIATMQRVPLIDSASDTESPWHTSLGSLLEAMR